MRVIAFGGLADSIFRWLGRGLVYQMRAKYPEVRFSYYGWGHAGVKTDEPCIVVGHSFGVAPAIRTVAASPKAALLLIDPRMPPWGFGGVKTPRPMIALNFYQTGAMRGYEVDGAQNFRLTGYGHTALPWHPRVHAAFSELMS